MIDDSPPPAQNIITRTLTMTTLETWSITIAPGDACAEAGNDRVVEEAKPVTVEEEA